MSVVVDDRIAERRQQVRAARRRRRLRRTVAVVVLAVLAGVAFLIERSDLVALQEVRVLGVERLTEDAVRTAADLELGTSTLRLRLGAAEERVEALPMVLRADASRADPLTVEIAVTERVPYVTVEGSNGAVLVDAEGHVISEGRGRGLPTIRLPGAVPAPGATVAADAGLAGAFRLATTLPGPLRARVARYVVDGSQALSLRLDDGVQVLVGDVSRLPEKARALGAVLEDVGETSVSVIDVRAPSNPTVRP